MDENMRIILASASPRRRELLCQVGLKPEIIPSHVEEKVSCMDPEEAVKELSRQKAEDVAENWIREIEKEKRPMTKDLNAVVIGADTVVAVDGMILGKPASTADAVRMIEMLQGREHQVYTGVTMCFCPSGRKVTFAEKTDVFVYPMNHRQIERYVAMGESLDKAGAYGIQGCFAAYIRRIEGDYNNVVGLPIGRVCQELLR